MMRFGGVPGTRRSRGPTRPSRKNSTNRWCRPPGSIRKPIRHRQETAQWTLATIRLGLVAMFLADLHQQCVKFVQVLHRVAAFFRAHGRWAMSKAFLASASEIAGRQRLFD